MRRIQPLSILFLLLSAGLFTLSPAVPAEEAAEGDSLRAAAEKGDLSSQFKLANEYFYGTPERRINYTLAAYWYRKVADAGVPEGEFNYGLCLDRGLGVERNPLLAYFWYEKAAKADFKPALLNCALMLLRGIPSADGKSFGGADALKPDPHKALEILEYLSASSFAPAEEELCVLILADRSSSERNRKRAFDILSRLAASPEASARVFRLLADCYYGGFGTDPDPAKTVFYLEKASTLQDPEAKAKLAHFHEYGLHVAADPARALKLYREAALAGFPMAQLKYGDMVAEGKEEGKGLKDALEWYRKSALNGCPQAFFKLGVFAGEGIGMRKSPERAAEFFFQAAKMGYARAQYNVAVLYLEEDGPLGKDESAAVYWFREAAKNGDVMAQRRLGLCYLEGRGVERNFRLGREWLERAASGGDPAASDLLESLSQRGGVIR